METPAAAISSGPHAHNNSIVMNVGWAPGASTSTTVLPVGCPEPPCGYRPGTGQCNDLRVPKSACEAKPPEGGPGACAFPHLTIVQWGTMPVVGSSPRPTILLMPVGNSDSQGHAPGTQRAWHTASHGGGSLQALCSQPSGSAPAARAARPLPCCTSKCVV